MAEIPRGARRGWRLWGAGLGGRCFGVFGCFGGCLLLLFLAGVMGWGQGTQRHGRDARAPATSPNDRARAEAKKELDSCRVYKVTSLPGSHEYAGDFIEVMASDSDPRARDPDVIWGLTADLSGKVPAQDQAMYISKSTNGGVTWAQVARVDAQYFDSKIDEGLRNGLKVAPGGTEFVITTQKGAFQVIPQAGGADAVVKPIAGPRQSRPSGGVRITKKEGEPVRAAALEMTPDGRHLIVGYGYFDLHPQIFTYHKDGDGSWVEDGVVPHIPTEMDILSMQFDDVRRGQPGYLYVGTGDQVYLWNLRKMVWSRVDGVGDDSAIHAMTVVGGLHLAACWGVYNPAGPGMVKRLTGARFILHRDSDEAGPNIRAYGIDVDPLRTNREIVSTITGVYVSEDGGDNWRRLNELPDGEFRSAHFNSDGSVVVSGFAGTFLVKPFSGGCTPQLKTRGR